MTTFHKYEARKFIHIYQKAHKYEHQTSSFIK